MIEYHEGAGAGHVANKSQTDKLVLWTPATWKFTRRALDGQGCGTGGAEDMSQSSHGQSRLT